MARIGTVLFCALSCVSSIFFIAPEARAATSVGACGDLTAANETYVLSQNVSSDKTCFTIRNNGITLDLNGHTVTYGNYSAVTVPNADFETGSGTAPDSWSLSNAPDAERFAGTYVQPVTLYSGDYGMRFVNPSSAQYIRSNSQITFSANTTYALTAMVYNRVSDDITMYVELEGTDYRAEQESRTWRGFQLITHIFRPTSDVTAYVRAGIEGTGLAGDGTVYIDDIKLQSAYYHGVALPTYWEESRVEYNYYPDVNLNLSGTSPQNITIKNGTITQGSGNGYFSNDIQVSGGSGITIEDITATVHGMQSSNIYGYWGNAYTVHGCTLTSNVQTIVSRDNNHGSMLIIARSTGGNVIYDNAFYNGPQDAIYISDSNDASEGGSEIYGNTFQLKTRYTNSFAVENGGRNADVHDNIILNTGDYWGRGFHILNSGEYYNNYIEFEDQPVVQEYDGCIPASFGVQLEGEADGASDIHLYNNTIIAHTDAGGCSAAALRFSAAGTGNVIDGNTLTAVAGTGATERVYALSFTGGDQSGSPITNNTITSNSSWIYFYYWGDEAAQNVYAKDNTFALGDNLIDFIPLYGANTAGNTFVNNAYGSANAQSQFESADIQMYGSPDENSSFSVQWAYDPVVRDAGNNPISGAAVTITRNGAAVFIGTTGADGTLANPPGLTEFVNAGGSVTTYGSYTVSIGKSGYSSYLDTVDPAAPMSVVIALTPTGDSEPATCLESWSCTEWAACSGGTSTRTCTDLNSCGTTNDKPAETAACQMSPGCIEDWLCTAWSPCAGGEQIRACVDRSSCGTHEDKPAETFDCSGGAVPSDDDIAPNTQIISGPAGTISSRTAGFRWIGVDDQTDASDLVFSYRLDSNDWSAWSTATSVDLRKIRNGEHTFSVRARDLAGNVDASPASVSFSVEKLAYIAAAPGEGGGPQVRVFDHQGNLVTQFFAFEQEFRGGVAIAFADLGGDGIEEIIVGAGYGRAPEVRIFRQDGTFINSFMAYADTFRGGVSVGAGDFDADGIEEAVTAPLSGGGPNVRIFGYRNGSFVPIVENFMAYPDTFRGGLSLAVSDVEGDGIDEIITVPLTAGGPHVRMFGIRDGRFRPVTLGYMAYADTFRGGVSLASGNFNEDAPEEVITGVASGGGPHVRMFGRTRYGIIGLVHPGFFAFMPQFRGGVSLAAADFDSDGIDEIVSAVRSGSDPLVRVHRADGSSIVSEFYAFPRTFRRGIRIATGG
ncbi:MAG: hypothetical protein WC505_05480 [Patescibacteria group bacterium]